MATEAQLRISLQLNGPLTQKYQSQPTSYNADVSIAGGPTPGELLVSKAGTNVSLTQLNSPGLCWIMNLGVGADGSNLAGSGNQSTWTKYVEVGVWDPATNEFYPMFELLPGEFTVIRISRFIGTDIGTGSGTTPGGSGKQLRLKAIGQASRVVVNVFEK